MTAVEASSVRVQTMADGTLRLTVDVEPRFAVDAFRLFGAPGVPLALAALKIGAGQAPATATGGTSPKATTPDPAPPKGGPLAVLAGKWCADVGFQTWVLGEYGDVWDAVYKGQAPAETAACVVRRLCKIDSRAELDSNNGAASLFNAHFRGPYSTHLKARGVTA